MKVVYCPCGKSVEVEAEDQVVGNVGQPSESDPPEMVGKYWREQISGMALELAAPSGEGFG